MQYMECEGALTDPSIAFILGGDSSNVPDVSTSKAPTNKERLDAIERKIDKLALPRQRYDVLTVIILLGALANIAGLYFLIKPNIESDIRRDLDPNIESKLKERGFEGIPQQVSKIQTSVDDMRHDLDLLLQKELKTSSSLPQHIFDKSFKEISAQLHLMENRNIPVDPQTVQNICARLRATPASESDYWPTVLQFIKFASAKVAPGVPPPGPPDLTLNGISIQGKSIGIPQGWRVLLNGGYISDYKFVRNRIIFTMDSVHMRNVTFVDCVFDVPITATPTPYLKEVSLVLLASGLSTVNIPSL